MQVLGRRRLGGVVWGGGFAVAIVWGALDSSSAEGVGYGFSPPIELAALETGRVLEVPVHLHDSVRADQVLVRMDPAPAVEEKQVVMAQLLAVQEEAATAALNEARRFAEGVEGQLVNRAKLSATLQEDLAFAETLRERLSIEADLAGTGASSTQAVAEWERQLKVVEARISANRAAVAIASQAADQARLRNDGVTEGNVWNSVMVTRQIEALDGRIARMDLTAGIDGQVTWIYRSQGEVVPAGMPVLQVRRTGTREVVAFFPPEEVVGLEAGETATVRRSTGQVVHGTLRSVGAGPQPVPVHLWKLPSWPEYGVPVVVELDAEVAPDEPVVVRL